MKIVQVSPYYPPATGFGGPPEVAHSISKKFYNLGHEVCVITTNINSDAKELSSGVKSLDGIKVTYLSVSSPRYWKRGLDFDSTFCNECENADLIIIHTIYTYFTWRSLSLNKKYFNKRVLVFSHGMLDFNALRKNFLFKRSYLKFFIQPFLRPRLLVFNAEEEKLNSLFNNYGVVIENAVNSLEINNLVERNEVKIRYPDSVSKRKFIFLGRLDPKKGLDILVSAFSEFTKERNDCHLFIVGNDSKNHQKILKKSGYDSQSITFVGPLYGKSKYGFLASCDVFVQPSYYEGLSISLLEAMTLGLTIITSNRVGLCTKLSDKNAGIIIEPRYEELYSALHKSVSNTRDINKMGERCKEIVQKEHNWKVVVNKILLEVNN